MLRGQPGMLWETHVGNAVMLRGQPGMLQTHVGNARMLRGQRWNAAKIHVSSWWVLAYLSMDRRDNLINSELV